MENFYMYCRKSSEDKDRQVQSIEDQEKVMEQIAKARNLKIIKIFKESQSAKKPGRPEFAKMLEGIRRGEASGIITWKLDRLSRCPIDGGDICWMLQQRVLKKIVTSDREYNSNDNILMMSVEFGMANQFIIDLSKNVKRGMNSKCEKGWKPGLAPIGYINELQDHTIIRDLERFHLVRKMWDMMLTGMYSAEKIGKIANEEWGFRTIKRKKSGGKPLARSMVYKIFNNPFYYGEFVHNGETYKGKHEPMVTKEEYDIVQKLLGRNGNPRASKREFAFTGLLQCGECGCAITAEEKNKFMEKQCKIKRYIYYHCTKKRNHKLPKKCRQKSIEIENLEEQIAQFLSQIKVSDRFMKWVQKYLLQSTEEEIKDRESIRKNLEKQIKKQTQRLDNLIKLKIDPDNTDGELLSDEEFKSQKNEIVKQKKSLQKSFEGLDDRQTQWVDIAEKTFHFCQIAGEKFENGSLQEKRVILGCIGSKIILKDGKLSIRPKKVFRVISEPPQSEETEMRRFEPLEKGLNKPKKSTVLAANLAWLGWRDSCPRYAGS